MGGGGDSIHPLFLVKIIEKSNFLWEKNVHGKI